MDSLKNFSISKDLLVEKLSYIERQKLNLRSLFHDKSNFDENCQKSRNENSAKLKIIYFSLYMMNCITFNNYFTNFQIYSGNYGFLSFLKYSTYSKNFFLFDINSDKYKINSLNILISRFFNNFIFLRKDVKLIVGQNLMYYGSYLQILKDESLSKNIFGCFLTGIAYCIRHSVIANHLNIAYTECIIRRNFNNNTNLNQGEVVNLKGFNFGDLSLTRKSGIFLYGIFSGYIMFYIQFQATMNIGKYLSNETQYIKLNEILNDNPYINIFKTTEENVRVNNSIHSIIGESSFRESYKTLIDEKMINSKHSLIYRSLIGLVLATFYTPFELLYFKYLKNIYGLNSIKHHFSNNKNNKIFTDAEGFNLSEFFNLFSSKRKGYKMEILLWNYKNNLLKFLIVNTGIIFMFDKYKLI
jgi:hypothetical protein